jgi:hypothetical protein
MPHLRTCLSQKGIISPSLPAQQGRGWPRFMASSQDRRASLRIGPQGERSAGAVERRSGSMSLGHEAADFLPEPEGIGPGRRIKAGPRRSSRAEGIRVRSRGRSESEQQIRARRLGLPPSEKGNAVPRSSEGRANSQVRASPQVDPRSAGGTGWLLLGRPRSGMISFAETVPSQASIWAAIGARQIGPSREVCVAGW